MPYGVAVGIVSLIFIAIMMILISQRRLLPGIMMLFSFILLVLFITGIVGTALQLFAGPNVNNLCNQFVGNMRQYGPSVSTLAWLQQQNICKSALSPEMVCTMDGRISGTCVEIKRLTIYFAQASAGKPSSPFTS